jgi:hypothetical protein
MIYLGFAIRNPFSRRFKPLKTWVFSLTKNKTIEAGLYKTSTIIGGSVGITSFAQDHKGFSFDIELLGYQFDCMFYDNRHHEDY